MSRAEDTVALWTDAPAAVRKAAAPKRGRLVRKYALLFTALVGFALIGSSALDFSFTYQENKEALVRVQQEKADAAARRIEEFIGEIKRQIGWTTHAQWSAGSIDQRRFDYVRLLRQVPAITELSQLSGDGKEELKVSRLAMDVVGSGQDFSQSAAFTQARANGAWFSPVYFRKESEPYMTLAIARAGRNAGVTVAEINLKLIWDVITAMKIGQGGYAYVVDGHGRLIAHPDISLVLRDTDLSRLPQVARALASVSSTQPSASAATVAKSIAGLSVLTAHTTISPLGWLIFIEVPLSEAFAPLYGAAWRTGLLLVFGLMVAALAALLLARRMTGPIRALQEGAARIGAGELDRRIEIRTGDELEGLAGQFNNMAADLQKSYAELEQRVAERTAELSEALDQQTATAEVVQIINSSPGDLVPVFDAMLEKATRLCEATFGWFGTFDTENFQLAAQHRLPPGLVATLHRPSRPLPGTALARLVSGETLVHVADAADDVSGYPDRVAMVELGVRTAVWVALRKDDALLGAFVCYRQEARPFTDKQIALLQNFASQAVIAMENTRLLDEIRRRQAELRVTFDNMADGVAMFDGELRLAAWNRNFQKIIDLPDEFLAKPPTYAGYIRHLAKRGEFGAGADPEVELRRYTENAGRHYSFERTRPDNRVIEIRHNPVPSGGFVLIYSDITERKRSEAEIRAARDAAEEASRTIDAAYRELKAAQANLIQAEKMASLGQLTAGIAHEIKNPLNFVNNFANLSVELLDELKETTAPAVATLGEDKRAEVDETIELLTGNLEKIAEHGRRADGIVKSMLEHSRGGTGERRSIDLNGLIEEALNLAYHGARAQDQSFNVTLERNYDPTVAPIELVPQDVTRVCLNLCSNGFYAANKRQKAGGDPQFKPILKVTTRDLGDTVEISIRDNGTGIPAEIKDKLFQPFFTTKPTGEGTGLGLSISYDIVTQQHGGTITVDSRVGEFTEFTIRLPRSFQTRVAA
jgi:signal transduction histidine kinase